MKDSENKLSGSMHSFKRMLSFGILMVIAMTLFAQVKNVSGVVLDKKGESIIGASVLVKGTTNGTITDFDGNFVLRNVADNAILQISFVGYQTSDVSVKGQNNIKVVLSEDTSHRIWLG